MFHVFMEGLVVRPVRGRVQGETRKWIKNKSWHFLEERPNELAKSLREPEDFRRLYLHLCVRPRLRNVLSHNPQLRNTSAHFRLGIAGNNPMVPIARIRLCLRSVKEDLELQLPIVRECVRTEAIARQQRFCGSPPRW